jgi:general secretion pathway protein G
MSGRLKPRSVLAGRIADDGFTLVELLVVLAIMALLAGLVAPQVLRYVGKAGVESTMVQMKNVGTALELYHIDTGSYPPDEPGLNALTTRPPGSSISDIWNGPYLKTGAALLDAWGKPLLYVRGEGGSGIVLRSLGRDGQEGGEGIDADLEYRLE